MVPLLPANWLFQRSSLTLTTIPLWASKASKSFSLLLRISKSVLALHHSQFVEPIEFNASVLKQHIQCQVVRMTKGLHYSADASLPRPTGSIYYSHSRADTCLMRFQEIHPLSFAVWGQTRTPAPSTFPFTSRLFSMLLHLFMYCEVLCVQEHCPSSV